MFLQLGVNSFDHLVRDHSVDSINYLRWELRGSVDAMQTRHQRAVGRHLERFILIWNHSTLHRNDDQRTVDEYRVGQVLSDCNATIFEVFHIADARHDRTRNVTDGRVQANFVDFPDRAEKRLHLVLGGLWGNVGDLHHFGSRTAGHCG